MPLPSQQLKVRNFVMNACYIFWAHCEKEGRGKRRTPQMTTYDVDDCISEEFPTLRAQLAGRLCRHYVKRESDDQHHHHHEHNNSREKCWPSLRAAAAVAFAMFTSIQLDASFVFLRALTVLANSNFTQVHQYYWNRVTLTEQNLK